MSITKQKTEKNKPCIESKSITEKYPMSLSIQLKLLSASFYFVLCHSYLDFIHDHTHTSYTYEMAANVKKKMWHDFFSRFFRSLSSGTFEIINLLSTYFMFCSLVSFFLSNSIHWINSRRALSMLLGRPPLLLSMYLKHSIPQQTKSTVFGAF